MKQLRILLIEDSFVVREGLKALLSLTRRSFSIEEYDKPCKELVRKLEKSRPNLVMAKTELLRDIPVFPRKSSTNPVYYIGLTHEPLIKPLEISRFDFIIPLTADKNTLLNQLEQILNKTFPQKAESDNSALSKREQTILKHVALGFTNNEISEQLYISVHTVMTHRKNITRKLGIKTVSGLTVYAILNKLIKTEELKQPTDS